MGELLEKTDLVHIAPRHQRNGHALLACAARAPDAVHVIFRIVRQVEIHDQLQIIHVDAAARHVRGHEEIESARLELVHHACALRLGDAAVQTVGRYALRLQIVR